ncbi:MAG: ATP-binding cassette domain-containing protein [Blastocatellales bacterium]
MSLLTESEKSRSTAKMNLTGNAESVAPEDVVIRLEDVSVVYRAPSERIKSFKEYTIRLLKRQVVHQEFTALQGVNLELRRGEVFGLVGHNGAGKSTMLKIVSRVMKPTAGRVRVQGRIAPLLELGAGFHPELSGRENIFLNGTLLGYTRAEVEALFNGIVDFAELWDFIDAPLRTYSTGMAVRLGFAVATATRPDILIVDEVLSVGDEQFQEKCAARITEFRRQGTTILLVTHSSALVQSICDRAAWLDHGRLFAVGSPVEIIAQYHSRYHPSEDVKDDEDETNDSSLSLPAPVFSREISDEIRALEEQLLQREWYYPFDLPSGNKLRCYLPSEILGIHTDRLAMMNSVLDKTFGRNRTELSCLDIGCNQGYFAVKLAARSCQKVVGFDARRQNIEDAELIRQIYGLENLSFKTADLAKIETGEWEQFDVVLMLSLLFWMEDPIGALRTAKALTKRVLIIETPVAPEIAGKIDWGTHRSQKSFHGTFAVMDQSLEKTLPIGSLTDLSLVPGRETLLWLLERLGFARVEIVPPPADAYEQLATEKRIMVAAYV